MTSAIKRYAKLGAAPSAIVLPTQGDYIAHLHDLEVKVGKANGVPYVFGRLDLVDGPDKGMTFAATWSARQWVYEMQAAGIPFEDRCVLDKCAGDWIIRIQHILMDNGTVFPKVRLMVKA